MARCRRVPALDAETPRTSAISALSRPAWNLRAMSSRSRGGRRRERGADGAARWSARSASSSSGAGVASAGSAASAAVRLRRRSSSSAALRAIPNSQARSCRGAASKRARLRNARSNALRGDVLGGRAVAQQRRDVGVDVVARRAVERLEVEAGAGRAWWERERSRCWSRRYYGAPARSITD